MACITVLAATANAANLARYAQELTAIANNSWWNLPTKNAVLTFPEWFAPPEENDDTLFTNQGHPLFDTEGGWADAQQTLALAYQEVLQSRINIRTTGGGSVNESVVTPGFNLLTNAGNDLKSIIDGNYLDKRYGMGLIGGTFVQPIIRWGDMENGFFLISGASINKLDWAQTRLTVAAQRMMEVAESLLLGCTEDDGGDDDNCDRIADALEAIAAKDFTCPEPDLTPVIEAVEKLSGAIGVTDLDAGIKLPKLITNPPKDNRGGDNDYITVNSIPEFLAWNFRQLDALFGRFPITIIQEDADITEEGDQENKIVIPNLSEGIAELIALNAVQLTNSDAILKSNISTLGEVITAKKILVQAKFILDNLQEFAGMGIKQKTIKMPVSANMLKTKLAEALEPTEIDVIVDDYVLNTDGSEFDVDRIGKIVNTIYAIVSAAFVHRINKDAPEDSIRSDLMKIRDGLALVDSEDEDTFSQFIERAETAFSDAPGSMDNATPTPYGRDRDRRPLIRRTEGMGDDDIKDGDTDQP